tara:strand:+ start:511 stop:684 length:174 start_codon:yes stop_codon:yes gene_type:complete
MGPERINRRRLYRCPDLHSELTLKGIDIDSEIKKESGSANFLIVDSDVNPILIDQRV